MSPGIILGLPSAQVKFAQALNKVREQSLQNALFSAVGEVNIAELDRQLAEYVSDEDMKALARCALRAELLFPVPLLLEKNPRLLGYYRLLLGYSQKELYRGSGGYGVAPFKSMEERGVLSVRAHEQLPDLCAAFCVAGSYLLAQLGETNITHVFLHELTLLTLGPQLRGGLNNQRGNDGINRVFEILAAIVAHARPQVALRSIVLRNTAGREVRIQIAADPDIVIHEIMTGGTLRKVIAIEVKGGIDVSNIHNRIGEAEKSHQKAKANGFTECWTIVNVQKLDMKKARMESPSTDQFYSLHALTDTSCREFMDFRNRILSLTSLPDSLAR